MGSANGGHYISLIDVNRDGKGNIMNSDKKNEKPNWVKFNDSALSEFNINDIPNDCYGGEIQNSNYSVENSSNAYLLIYERVKKNPIRVVIDGSIFSEETKKNIVEYIKDEEKFINIKYDINKPNNQINEEELYKIIFYNKDNDEYYKYIPYYNIPKCAPKEIYNLIISENKSLKGDNEKKADDSAIVQSAHAFRSHSHRTG